MVFVRDRRAEQRHEAVAEELVDRALVAMHLGQRSSKNRSSSSCIASGPSCSASGVESAMSQKSTVTCLRSPSSALRELRMRSARYRGV